MEQEQSLPSTATIQPNDLRTSDRECPTGSEDRAVADYHEIQYAVNSFYTIVKPVFLTMVLSALAVIYIRTPESAALGEASLSNTYVVLQGSEGDSTATQLGLSLVNGLIIVSAICVLTFVIVLLYKYRCMKCLMGYMIFSSTLLLGFLASLVFQVAIDAYELKIDQISFYATMYNFAIVGVISIFSPAGVVPVRIGQFYLIITSMIVAWQLSHFDPWTAWVLLVLLALYDLFAVLTPCGPLKALVNLMTADDAPSMPGLLYEASLPQTTQQGTTRAETSGAEHIERVESGRNIDASTPQATRHDTTRAEPSDAGNSAPALLDNVDVSLSQTAQHGTTQVESSDSVVVPVLEDADQIPSPPKESQRDENTRSVKRATDAAVTLESESSRIPFPVSGLVPSVVGRDNSTAEEVIDNVGGSSRTTADRIACIPVALAKIYKLRFLENPQPPWISGEEATFTAEQLCEVKQVIFPRRGGRIVPTVTLDTPSADLIRRTQDREETRYTIISYSGEHKRVLFVNNEGRVFEDMREKNAIEAKSERTHIKLGLGDFIFYSILVSKAALYSYTTFAVCTLAILSGLGLTLLLLAMYGKALPALPISIFLGVVYFLYTRYVMEPWIQETFIQQTYA